MNAQQRAEKIYDRLQTAWVDGDMIHLPEQEKLTAKDKALIAAQIEDAEREAYERGRRDTGEIYHGFQTCKIKYDEGFSLAREMAKGIANSEEWNAGDIHACCAEEIAERLAAMEPPK